MRYAGHMTKDNNTESPDAVEQAMNTVLQAERAAEQAIADCRQEAQQTVQAAQQRAQRIAARTDERLSLCHMRCSGKLNKELKDRQRAEKAQQSKPAHTTTGRHGAVRRGCCRCQGPGRHHAARGRGQRHLQMSETARFRYVQARLQSRHGDRADDLVWRRLQSIGDLANYLQAAQQTTLRRWVTGMHSKHSSHEIEFMLRRHFRDYVDEVAHWLPTRWTGSIQLLKRVPDLPALQHLMAGEPLPAWMFDDPELSAFASENQGTRLEAMQNPDLAWLAEGWQQDRALVDTWLDYWRSKWPSAPRLTAGLDQLARLMQEHIHDAAREPRRRG